MARNDRSKGEGSVGGSAGNGRQRQVRRRQQEILDAAAAIFREKGYEATSTQDIAEAVGLLKGSLYYYIDSKEDLLFAIIDEAYKGALETLERSKAMPGNALQKLRWMIESHVEYFTANQVKMAVLFRDFRSLSEERQQIISGEGDQYLEEVRSLIRQGQAEGVVAPDIDPRLTSLAVTGMVNSLSQWYDPSGPNTPAELSMAFARLVIAGLATRHDNAIAAIAMEAVLPEDTDPARPKARTRAAAGAAGSNGSGARRVGSRSRRGMASTAEDGGRTRR